MSKQSLSPSAIVTLAAAMLAASLSGPALAAAPGPSIDKNSMFSWISRRTMYYPQPGKGDTTRSSWLPNFKFKVNGPIEAGTRFVVEVWNGKTPWLTFDLPSEAVPAGGAYVYQSVGSEAPAEKATIYTGPVVYTIRAVNGLSNLNQWLYKGVLDVKKYDPLDPAKFPNFKYQYDYYVDQDWRMPFGTLTGNWYESLSGGVQLNPTPIMTAHMWFRGDSTTLNAKTQAHLFYQGKDIGRGDGDASTWGAAQNPSYLWSDVSFTFSGNDKTGPVFYYDTSTQANHPNAFVLSQHPGDYEIKVLHNGKLSRSLKFSVDSKGAIVDNGYSTQLATLGSWTFPVKTLAQTDGAWNAAAWKTGAYYGNPVTGFVVP